jgi:hypothetical protein
VSDQLPKPENTLEAYEATFRGRLCGRWSNAGFTSSPADTSVVFQSDGTAHYLSGAGGFLGGGSDFKWRQVGDFAIEVTQDGEKWSAVTYFFTPGSAELWALFSSDDVHILFESSDDAEDWVGGICYVALPLCQG